MVRRWLAVWSAWAALAAPAAAIQLQPVATGLSFPVVISNAGDGSGRLFIVEQPGVIRIYDGSQLLPTPFLDITGLITNGGERGLLGLIFHPDYPATPYFYVNYTCAAGSPSCATEGDTVIARYQVSADPNVADPASELVVLALAQPEDNHNGGQLQFGPNDGYLYIALGDGGGGGDDHGTIGNGQDLTVLLGKMLRIDVDAVQPPLNYAIPPDNPFVNSPPARPEIWAYGLRNPWRFSFDRATGDMFIGDVGQACFEELDYQPAASGGGENYGWRIMEATHCFDFSDFGNCAFVGCSTAGLTLPIIEYQGAAGNCSEIAGYRYRGSAIPSLAGTFLDTDFCAGDIRGAVDNGGTWTSTVLLSTGLNLSSFGEDEAGELYVADYGNGAVHRIVDSGPSDLSLTQTDSADPTIAGEPLSYTLAVANAGPAVATSVTLTDTLPAGVAYLFSQPFAACDALAGVVTCDLGAIDVGGSATALITVGVALSTSGILTNAATVSSNSPDPDPANNDTTEDTAVIAGDSGLVELTHASAQVHDLAALSPTTPDQDFYLIGQRPFSSYEVVVDATSGDIGTPVQLERMAPDTVTVLQTGEAVSAGLDMVQSLRWTNTTSFEVDDELVRIRAAPGACSTDCGPDDTYRVRAFETTYSLARFNNAGSQVTVLILQNPSTYPISGEIYFWSNAGAFLDNHYFSLPPRETLVLNTSTLPGANGQGGTITVVDDGRYGDLAGKTVALEVSTGFSFDTPMLPRPR